MTMSSVRAKVTQGGQVNLPVEFRKAVGLEHGGRVVIELSGKEVRIRAVDEIIGRVQVAGGVLDPSPIDDYDFMYGRSFEDPDGHLWGVMWLDVAAATAAQSSTATA